MRRYGAMLLFAALAFTATFTTAAPNPTAKQNEDQEVKIGLKIAPVQLNLDGKDTHKVGLGSYIVNAQAACANCHSCPTYQKGHNPYKGQKKQFDAEDYLSGGVLFIQRKVFSANITPDAHGLPAGLTLDQFRHVMRTGEDPNHSHRLLQIMPWPFFQDMTTHDIDSIYAYLTAIPSAEEHRGGCKGPGE
jgi:hypothetical protein